jgi:hypothetical protein
MGKKQRAGSPEKVRTTYELWYIRSVLGVGIVSPPPTSYDELERFEARADYEAALRQAHEEVGHEISVVTDSGNEVKGVVDRVAVELLARKVGNWISPAKVESHEVLMDDTFLTDKVRAVRDGLLAVAAGERAKLFARALQGVGTPATPGRDTVHGRVCPEHNRWVGSWQTDDRCFVHVYP